MENKISRESFTLSKLKLLPTGGIDSTVNVEMVVDGTYMEIERKQKTPIIPDPDLTDQIKALKDIYLMACGYMQTRTIVNAPEFGATVKQKKAVDKYIDILRSKTTITGVHLSGQGENEGVIITGQIKAANSSNVTTNSPRMRFTSEVYGCEEELEAQVNGIETELYLYLQEGKKMQLEIFGEKQTNDMFDEQLKKIKERGE